MSSEPAQDRSPQQRRLLEQAEVSLHAAMECVRTGRAEDALDDLVAVRLLLAAALFITRD